MSNSKRCLVTGGAGFIGSHIVDALLERGHTVGILDDLSSGKRHFVPDGVTFFEQSITADLDAAFSSFKPEIIYHEAAHISVSVSTREPAMDADRNIMGTINVLEAAVRHGVERVIYAGSGASYGEPVYLPLDEKHSLDAVSPYGISKAVAERYLYYYRVIKGIETITLRYANVYGPRQDPHGEAGVVAIFSEKLVAGETPTIFGDGLQTRDYVYVKDVARANMRAMEVELADDAPHIFNVSTQIETNVIDLYEIIREEFQSPIKAVHADKRPGDVYKASLSNRLIQEHLNWKPQVLVREGLAETVEYFKRGGTKNR